MACVVRGQWCWCVTSDTTVPTPETVNNISWVVSVQMMGTSRLILPFDVTCIHMAYTNTAVATPCTELALYWVHVASAAVAPTNQ
jgi:hypothetical protein